MLWISVTTSPIFWVLVRRASSAALAAIAAERVTC
jgi:hypothetical protein